MYGDDITATDEKINFFGVDNPGFFMVDRELQNQETIIVSDIKFRPLRVFFGIRVAQISRFKFVFPF